ncbi:M1 family aminopeptidase [Phormidium sp. FACHB-1136]|uniref:ABC transporter permease/M1 family aminopeptidase n=1 Tax=Phormidium sp. FACHB-1136 TaxID=2692848 RepID=UPI0016856315|nr:M1 family aminopeptidase [Phormidium sp. FACHB-1136]MBD2428816.1 hypothetical protein [Phormidium sp. FACHB-1136]
MTTQSPSPPSTQRTIFPWQPVWEIVRFELQDSLRTRSLLLGFGFFLVAGLVTMHGLGSDLLFFPTIREVMGANPRPGELVPYANAPLQIMQVFKVANFLVILLTVGIFAERATKDFTSSMDGLLFTSPLKEWQFGAGRFIASTVIILVMSLGLGLGLIVGEGLPWMETARMAPFNLLTYLQPYLYLILPNILIFGLISFGLGLLTRRSLAGYLGFVALLLAQILLEGILGLLRAGPFFVALINPLGSSPIDYTVRFWTKVEQNTLNVPFAPVIWLSRLLYLALSVAFFVWVWQQFSFSGGASGSPGRLVQLLAWAEDRLIFWKAKPQTEVASAAAPLVRDLDPAPATQPHYGLGAQVNHAWRIAKLDLKRLIWNPLTLAILAISLIATGFLLVLMFASGGNPILLPTTNRVVDGMGLVLGLVAPLLIVFLAGDLVWREREVKVDPLVDSLPARSWSFVVGKLLVLAVMLVLALALLVFGALLAQTFNGYTQYNLGVYGVGLFTITLVDLLLVAVLAMTVQVLVNQKFLGYVLSALLVVLFTAGGNVLFRNARLLQYGFRPKSYYSDLSGYGSMLEPVRWYQGYWLAIALLLICVTALFWVRGVDTQPKQRWRIARQRFTRPMQMVMALSAVAALLLGGWIYYNTTLLSAGTNRGEGIAQLMAYEQTYGPLRDAQPKITAISLQGDLYPNEDSRFAVKGTYTLENQTPQPIDTILIQVPSAVQMNQIALVGAPEGQPVEHPALQGYAFTLPTPLPPGGTIEASFDLVRQPTEGFANDPGGKLAGYVDNGVNFGSNDFLPQVGFNDRLRFLISPEMRDQAGLPQIDPEAEQARAAQVNANHPDTHLAQFSAILSTAPDQIILTSGEQMRGWTEGNRRYFEYQSQVPIEKQVPFISGRYEVKRDDWQGIPIEVYYHPDHDRNLDRILAGAKQSLDYATQQFGPYPHRSLRIVETPYVSEAISYPGGQIFMGENQVFLANLKDDGTQTLDSAFHIAAHEVAHQWWGHQIHISHQRPGDRVLTESLAEYTANQVYSQEFGTTGLGAALRNNLNLYLQNRSRSDVPLVEAGEGDNHLVYQKGGLVMYTLQDYLGEALVNQTLAQFLRDNAAVPPYPTGTDLVAALRAVTPEKYQYLLTDLFETVTLYDNRITAATVSPRADGKFDVTLTVNTAKVRSDEVGNETPAAMNQEDIDVGIYNTEGQIIYLQKHPFSDGESSLIITVDQQPIRAGIDPLHKLIDKLPDDNIAGVAEA